MKKDELLRRLAELGDRHKEAEKVQKAVRVELKPLIVEANRLDVPQVDIVELTGYTREWVRQICLPPEQAEQEAEARRKRRRKT